MATAAEIQAHYDVDNEFYAIFLDRDYRTYSCAVWEGAETLERAQQQKLARIARFADVKTDDSVLDIGCGWGGMMKYCREELLARETVGLTLSKAQCDYVARTAPAPISIHLCSWRDYERGGAPFDALVSIGAFEHFASLHDRRQGRQVAIYRDFFRQCQRLSRPAARLGLQTIVAAKNPDSMQSARDARFLLSDIFQGTALPRVSEIHEAMEGLYEEQQSVMIGQDYAKTLTHWQRRLEAQREHVIARYGSELFERYCRYFVAARRSFENGYIDLRQMSLRRLS
jgi:cyclopropane-fatty-acyl-phospholipid synthase